MANLTQEELQTWHHTYMSAGDYNIAASDAVNAVRGDELDYNEINTEIQSRIKTTLVTTGLCAPCQHLLEHWPVLLETTAIVRHFDSIDVEAAARNGCKLCTFLLTRLKAHGRLEVFRKLEARLKLAGDVSTASLTVQDWGGNLGSHNMWINFPGKEAHTGGSLENGFQSYVVRPGQMFWREDLRDLDLAKIWLSECLAFHQNCDKEHTGSYSWPSRLVEIQPETAKLVLTKHVGALPQYATLSYCWGREEFTMLKPTNINSFLHNIKVEDLPSIFQDAILVTRRMGLRYIWIDALCIIQDPHDTSDWAREAGLMCSVYGGSILNIAASSATGVHGSLFDKRKHHSGGFCTRVTAADDSGPQYSQVRTFFAQLVYEESVSATQLASRGWTLQERLLPCRTLFLGKQGLFWECRSVTASEFIPDGFPKLYKSFTAGPADQAWDWPTISRLYSATNLTYDEDRLPALAGVARHQSELSGDQYLAGLWRKDLELQLTWRVEHLDKRCRRPCWRAPSWSWMSVDGEISFFGYTETSVFDPKRFIHVLDATVEPAAADPFGALLGGSITMACSALVPGRVQSQLLDGMADTMLIETGSGPAREIPVILDCLLKHSTCVTDRVFILPVFSTPIGRSWCMGDGTAAKRTCISKCEEENLGFQIQMTGLVLERHGCSKEVFRRVGVCCLIHSPWVEFEFWPIETVPQTTRNQYYHTLLDASDKIGAATAETECARVIEAGVDKLPKAKYVITIR